MAPIPPAPVPGSLRRLAAGAWHVPAGFAFLFRHRRLLPLAILPVFLVVVFLIAGMVLCFAKALGEFGATITFVSNIPGETQTISAAIYTLTQVPGGDAAAGRLVLVAIAISLAALVVAEWLARRAGTRFHGE